MRAASRSRSSDWPLWYCRSRRVAALVILPAEKEGKLVPLASLIDALTPRLSAQRSTASKRPSSNPAIQPRQSVTALRCFCGAGHQASVSDLPPSANAALKPGLHRGFACLPWIGAFSSAMIAGSPVSARSSKWFLVAPVSTSFVRYVDPCQGVPIVGSSIWISLYFHVVFDRKRQAGPRRGTARMVCQDRTLQRARSVFNFFPAS